MTKEELLDIDAKIAVRFFGWKWFRDRKRELDGIFPPDDGVQIRWNFHADWFDEVSEPDRRFTDWADHLPRYSGNMNEAYKLLEELKRRNYTVEIMNIRHILRTVDEWRVKVLWLEDFGPMVVDGIGHVSGDMSKPWFWGVDDESLPVAICKAALLAEER